MQFQQPQSLTKFSALHVSFGIGLLTSLANLILVDPFDEVVDGHGHDSIATLGFDIPLGILVGHEE